MPGLQAGGAEKVQVLLVSMCLSLIKSVCFVDSDPIRLSSWNETRSCRQKESCVHLCCYGNRYGGQSFPGAFWQLGWELWLLVRHFPLLYAFFWFSVYSSKPATCFKNNHNAKLIKKIITVLSPVVSHFRFLTFYLFHMAYISK